MFLQIAFSRPTWEVSGSHFRVATDSFRSPDLQDHGCDFETLNFNDYLLLFYNLLKTKTEMCLYIYIYVRIYNDDFNSIDPLYAQIHQ